MNRTSFITTSTSAGTFGYLIPNTVAWFKVSVTILRDRHRCHPEVVMLLRSGALGMNCHPEGALATEGSPPWIRGDPSPRVTRFRMTLKRRHIHQVHWKGALATEGSRGVCELHADSSVAMAPSE